METLVIDSLLGEAYHELAQLHSQRISEAAMSNRYQWSHKCMHILNCLKKWLGLRQCTMLIIT